MARSGMKKWELVLVVLAVLILGGSGYVYYTGFPIGKYILGLTEGQAAKQVAVLSQAQGNVRRQKEGDADFEGVTSGAALYDADTIVTAPNSTDRIEFPDGSYIVMSPSTMVRLSFGANLTLGGVVRTASVEVVNGSVTGESKSDNFSIKNHGQAIALRPPKPSPRPTSSYAPMASPSPSPSPSPSSVKAEFEMVFPKAKAHLAVPNGSQVAEVPITFEWKMAPRPEEPVVFSLVQRWPKARIIFRKDIDMRTELSQLPLAIKRPGTYRWAIGSKADQKHIYGYADFTIDPVYQAIQLNEPLVGGMPTQNDALRGKVVKNYDINFSWQPYADLKNYEISFYLRGDAKKSIFASSVAGTSYEMNQDKVFTGQTYYRILGRMPNGFVVVSPVQQFTFSYLPPVPATPASGASFSKRVLLKEDNSVLFTWQKTNFTRDYQIEISTDPGFASTIVSTHATENFYALKNPQPGTYYWRVRSFSDNGKASSPSAPASVTITP